MGLTELEALLQTTTPIGTRTAVLLLGNGMHIQAAMEAGLNDPDPWLLCMRNIANELGIEDLGDPESPQAIQWDALVKRVSVATRQSLSEASLRLQARLISQLRVIEQTRRHLPLFGRIIDLNFENILSLNIDRTLALHSGREAFVTGGSGRTLFYSYSLIQQIGGAPTRIPYLNGNTHDADRIPLGTADHPGRLMSLENQRAPMMHDWVKYRVASWSYRGAKPHVVLRTPQDFYERTRKSLLTWYPLMFVAPLVIIGARLPLADWPMWWLLHQRARNLTPFQSSEIPPVFYLTATGEAGLHLAGRPAEIEVVEFPSYEALWKFVLR